MADRGDRSIETGEREILRVALEACDVGLIVLDADGVVAEANGAASAALGPSHAGIVGSPLRAIIDSADRRRFDTCLRRVARTGEGDADLRIGGHEWHLRMQLVPATTPPAIVAVLGQSRTRETTAIAVEHQLQRYALATVAFDRELRVVFANAAARRLFGAGVVGAGADLGAGVVELRPLLERLARTARPLRPTIVDLSPQRSLRVHGLAAGGDDPAVLFAEDVSEELVHDRVMREFLRNAAHQLRTPLAGITAAVETLQAGAKERPPDRDRFLAHVEHHADRLSRIARGLLLLARAEMGEAVPIDVLELAPIVDEIAAETTPRTGVRLTVRCPSGLAAVATPDLLRETLGALVDNAVAHTRAGEIVVDARLQDGRAVLDIADSGPGIAPEFLDRIFEPFFRATADGEGYGLGLAIAAQAVRAMQGEISVSSTVGVGTTFTVSLPAATVAR